MVWSCLKSPWEGVGSLPGARGLEKQLSPVLGNGFNGVHYHTIKTMLYD